MNTKQPLHCRLCDAPFSIPLKLSEIEESHENGSRTKPTLPPEIFEWLSELRFIGKSPIFPSGVQLRTLSLQCQLEYCLEGDNEFTVYQLPEQNVADVPEDGYSFYTKEGNRLDTRLFPLHEQCIELLQKLKAAYNLTTDQTWRFLAEETTQILIPEEYSFANPIHIPSLTTYILSLLHHQPNRQPPSPTLSLSSPVCYADYGTHHHEEQQEQEHLSETKSRISNLWDLDAEACISLDKVQSLQIQNWEDPGAGAGAPMGLRNRVRIWEGARRHFAQLGYGVG